LVKRAVDKRGGPTAIRHVGGGKESVRPSRKRKGVSPKRGAGPWRQPADKRGQKQQHALVTPQRGPPARQGVSRCLTKVKLLRQGKLRKT